MIEGSGSGVGAGSVSLTYGSGGPKTWILRIRIRIRNIYNKKFNCLCNQWAFEKRWWKYSRIFTLLYMYVRFRFHWKSKNTFCFRLTCMWRRRRGRNARGSPCCAGWGSWTRQCSTRRTGSSRSAASLNQTKPRSITDAKITGEIYSWYGISCV